MTAPSIPTVDIEGPAGRRVMVAPRSVDDRSATWPTPSGSTPGGRCCSTGAGRARTTRSARPASSTAAAWNRRPPRPDAVTAARPARSPVPCRIAGRRRPSSSRPGPGAGTAVHLPPGRHVVGRSAGAAVIPSPTTRWSPTTACSTSMPTAVVRFVQLTGRVTGRIGGEPIGEPVTIPDGAVARARRQPAADRPRRRTGRRARPCSRPRRATRGGARCGARRDPAPAGTRPPIPLPSTGRRVAAARRRRAGRRRD